MGCMFLMRTHRLGLVFFAVAIVAIYGQTFPAMLDYPEVVVRLTLWCIVVGLYPTLLMTLIGVLWFPSRAISQMHQALNDRLDDAVRHLAENFAPLPETRIEREALALQKLNVFCLADDANWRTQNAWWQSCVATVTYIYSTLNRYDPTSFADSQVIIEFRQKLAAEIKQAATCHCQKGSAGKATGGLVKMKRWRHGNVTWRISARRCYSLVRWIRIRRQRPPLNRRQWLPMPLLIRTICATR